VKKCLDIAVTKVESVTDRISIFQGQWCDVTSLYGCEVWFLTLA